jgi:hypothetical protein
MGKLVDRLPVLPLVLIALYLGFAPFAPEPHLFEKIRWLVEGSPFRPVDWFDLLLHGGPMLLVGWRLARMAQQRSRIDL